MSRQDLRQVNAALNRRRKETQAMTNPQSPPTSHREQIVAEWMERADSMNAADIETHEQGVRYGYDAALALAEDLAAALEVFLTAFAPFQQERFAAAAADEHQQWSAMMVKTDAAPTARAALARWHAATGGTS